MIFTVLGAVAELERNLIRERVAMGIHRARKQGKELGRPRAVFDREKARNLAETMSVRAIAKQLGVSKSLVARALQKQPGPLLRFKYRNRQVGIPCPGRLN